MQIFKKKPRWSCKTGKLKREGYSIIPVDSKKEIENNIYPKTQENFDFGGCIDYIDLGGLVEAVSFIFENNPELMLKYLNTKGEYTLNE